MCYFLSYLFSRPFQRIDEKNWLRTSRRIGLLFWSILFYSGSGSGFFVHVEKHDSFKFNSRWWGDNTTARTHTTSEKTKATPPVPLFQLSSRCSETNLYAINGQANSLVSPHIIYIAGKLVRRFLSVVEQQPETVSPKIVLYAKFWMARPVFGVLVLQLISCCERHTNGRAVCMLFGPSYCNQS